MSAHIGACAFGIVSQTFTLLRVLLPNGGFEQPDLACGVVNQSDKNVAHQFRIIQRDFP